MIKRETRGIAMRFVLSIMMSLVTVPAIALDGSFDAPEIGTQFKYESTTYTITSVNNYSILTKDTSNTQFVNYGHFVTYELSRWRQSAFSISRKQIKNLWPLDVGKRKEYKISDNSGIWHGTLVVLAIETISTPAGEYKCFKIKRKRRAVNDAWSDKATLWYSPDLNFIIKWHSKTTGGSQYGATNSGTLIEVSFPNKEGMKNLDSGNGQGDGSTNRGQNGKTGRSLKQLGQ